MFAVQERQYIGETAVVIMRAGGEERLMYLVNILKSCCENGHNHQVKIDGRPEDMEYLASELELACEEMIYCYRRTVSLIHNKHASW